MLLLIYYILSYNKYLCNPVFIVGFVIISIICYTFVMKKSELNLNILVNSYNTLRDCYKDYAAESDSKIKGYIKDSCIQRFEYTYESAKKIMSKFLKKEYDKTEKDLTINNIFREMYGLGLIKNFEHWVDYREKRNTTSHEYNDQWTYPIIEVIPQFIVDIEFLINSLNGVLQDD